MAKITRKSFLKTVDGTPKKRLFLSIISDYDLKTGICELIDNALDFWILSGRKSALKIEVNLDTDRQVIQVRDNAGGVSEENAELLVAPGASRDDTGKMLIGIFGVGGKRAGVALGELVEIRTHQKNSKSIQVELTKEWIESPDWDLDIYEIPAVPVGTTTVDISKVRQGFDDSDVASIKTHIAETYSAFLSADCGIIVNETHIAPIKFDRWAYPPAFLPRHASFQIEPAIGRMLNVSISGGLITDRVPEEENYGVYFYCNKRLIVKELKSRDVGYFISAEAGVPHPDASLCRVIVEFDGSAELMPWNSSKSGINFSHPALTQIRRRIIDFTSYYSGISRRLKNRWVEDVFPHQSGHPELMAPAEALSNKRRVFPSLPTVRAPSLMELLKEKNKKILKDKPWTLGLVEAMGFVDLLSRQKYETKNRVSLILLDSNFEIALKEFIVHRKDLFPSHIYTNAKLASIFGQRTTVIREVQNHVKLSKGLISKVNHYYEIRNNLIHQRATVLITNKEVDDYCSTIEKVLSKLFDLKFPKD